MFTTFDDVRDFALTFVDLLVEDKHIESDMDTDNENEFDIQDSLIEHFLERFKQDDCLIPGNQEEFEITDVNEDYGVAFISSGGIPLGIFKVFIDEADNSFSDELIEDRLYVSINHNVTYLDEHYEN